MATIAGHLPIGRLPLSRLVGNRTLVVIYITQFVFGFTAIAHESNLGAISSLLVGDSATQYGRVIGLTMVGLGIGYACALPLKDNARLVDRFLTVEICLTVLSGFSGILAFMAYTRLPIDYVLFIYLTVLVIAILVGLEDGLVVRIADLEENELRRSLGISFLMANVGGGVAGYFFGTHLLPTFGPVGTAVVLGLVDAAAVLFNLIYFRRRVFFAWLKILAILIIGLCLMTAHAKAAPIYQYLNQSLYEDKIVAEWSNAYGTKTITCWKDNCKLYIGGQLQFSSKDEYMYHELLVAPAMNVAESRSNRPLRVLIAGGGDALALREVLKYNVEYVALVDIDPMMTTVGEPDDDQEEHDQPLPVAMTEPVVSYNQGALLDPRVEVFNEDAFNWMMETDEVFDVVILDLVDPIMDGPAKLYTLELYNRIFGDLPGQGLLATGGVAVTQSVSPWNTPRTFWTIHTTLRAAAPYVVPYHYNIPSFNDWGFNMASDRPIEPQEMTIDSAKNRWLSTELWQASLAFDSRAYQTRDELHVNGEVSTIEHPRVLVYLKEEGDWYN